MIEQKLQNQRAAKAAAFDLEMGKAHGQIAVHNVVDADAPGVCHRPGKAIAAVGVRRSAMVLGKVLPEVLPADRFIALLPVLAAK